MHVQDYDDDAAIGDIDGDTTATTSNGSAAPLSNDEIAALAGAARNLLPGVEWVGLPMNFAYASGRWFAKINREKEEEVGATEAFAVDRRSFAEVWKRLGKVEGRSKLTITDTIGGRRVDGWINPPRHLLPENDQERWPLDDNREPKDPWQESWQIVLRRLADGQLFTWSAMYSSRRGMGQLLDAVARECGKHPGCAPVVLLERVPNGENFYPSLRIVDWQPFGDRASPPANPARAERVKEELRALHVKYAAPKTAAAAKKGKRGDMDDEIPF